MTPAEISTAPNWSFRADEAARSVTRLFGQRLFFLPGTHIAAVVRPSGRVKNLARPWHYWWQAHYVDCLVDTGRRELGTEGRPGTRFDGENRPSAGRLASQLVTGIRLRNFLTFVNNYYDDMAWLALSTLRLEKLAEDSRKAAGRRRNAKVLQSLTLQFDSASTDDLGGGTFWSKKRDFKNTPATAPVALYYARTGKAARAQALLDWLDARLFDPNRACTRTACGSPRAATWCWRAPSTPTTRGRSSARCWNSAATANLARASALVAAVARNLTLPAPLMGRSATVLRCEGTGDGGLFTGILVRYLALAAVDERLPAGGPDDGRDARQRHRRGLLGGPPHRVGSKEPLARKGGRILFSARPELPARRSYPAGAAVELSTQLQAWMVLEAAASITGRSGPADAGRLQERGGRGAGEAAPEPGRGGADAGRPGGITRGIPVRELSHAIVS